MLSFWGWGFSLLPSYLAPQVYQGLKIGYRFIDTVTLAYWCTFSVNSVGKEVLKQRIPSSSALVASLQGQPLRQRGQRGGCYPTSGSATWGAIPGDEDLVWRHGRENHRGPARIFEAGSKQWDFNRFHEIFGVVFLGEDWIDGFLVKPIGLQKKTCDLLLYEQMGNLMEMTRLIESIVNAG